MESYDLVCFLLVACWLKQKDRLPLFVLQDDSLKTHFLSSLCAGVVAATASTPCDVIKSRMMNSTAQGQVSWLTSVVSEPAVKTVLRCSMETLESSTRRRGTVCS